MLEFSFEYFGIFFGANSRRKKYMDTLVEKFSKKLAL